MWHLTVHLSAPPAGFLQELRRLLDRPRNADTYLVEYAGGLLLRSPDLSVVQSVAAWALRNVTVQTMVLEYVRE